MLGGAKIINYVMRGRAGRVKIFASLSRNHIAPSPLSSLISCLLSLVKHTVCLGAFYYYICQLSTNVIDLVLNH